MAGADENVALMGDWPTSNPSPRTFFSSLLNDDFSSKPFSDMIADNGCQATAPFMHISPNNSQKEGNQNGVEASGGPSSESYMFSGQKPPIRGSLAERMAARAGFNAPRLNTDSIRSASMSSSSPEVRSPYLTIPPGLSPTTLLDSPVFLSNSLTLQSPTTGKFSFGPFGDVGSISVSTAPARSKDTPFDIADVPFAFKPTMESSSLSFPSGENRVAVPTTHRQSLPSIEVSVQPAVQISSQNLTATEVYSQDEQEFCSQQTIPDSSSSKDAAALRVPQNVHNNAANSPPFDDQEDGDQKGEFSSVVVGAPAEDGYNWRKYGQKHVKGSEFPRSYYKCTHPNCQVKKKVERSHEGHITEIIYKGAHSHPKPPPNRRAGIGSQTHEGDNNTAQHGAQPGLDGEQATWTNNVHGNANGGANCMMTDVLDGGPSGSASTEFCDPSTSMQGPGGMETADVRDVSSTMSNEEDDDDRGTHGSVSLGGEDEGDESESKRRKMDACVMEISGATRAIREPRVVVQTTSEVDILDDGYRWRKYGQKVVKGNPNPRSYYKCTNAGCTVRKHVERASHDLKSVITTYEGKHNHDVPAARNSSHVNSTPSSTAPAPPPFISRAEPSQVHDSLPRFDRQNMLGTFNLPGRPQMAPIPSFSFGLGQPNLSSLAMANLGSAAQGKLAFPMQHSYLGQQQQQPLRKPNEWGLMMPKGEPKEEPPLESGLPVSNASAVYHQLMSRMPLGPQL